MADWLIEQSPGKPPAVYEVELRERMVRVEEELKHQRELMRQGFAQMDKRFEVAEQRHQELRQDILGRFELADQRDQELRQDMLGRFEVADQHRQELRQDMLARFEGIQQDIRELQRRTDRFLVWSFSTTLAVGALVVSLVRFWNP